MTREPPRRSGSPRRRWPAVLASLGALAVPRPAGATGMQGHMYMAQCAAEQAGDARLRALFGAQPLHLANGAFFPDSGYTADDHDQGEIPHWEQYVEGYIRIIRDRHAPPYDDPEAARHVAFLMGVAAHGITDSTFDSLFLARAAQVEPGDMDTFDAAMDVFLVHDRPRYYVPELAYDAQTNADVFQLEIPHPVSPEAIDGAMSTAWSGISVVAKYLYLEADAYGADYPWARARLLDPRTPGGYAFGAKVVGGYYRELLRRLDGDPSADGVLIGAYPDASYPLATLDPTRPDGRIVLFFGEGIDRASIDETTVIVRDEQGSIVPATVAVFRGDQWANVITVELQTAWLPSTKYTATVSQAIRTLQGVSPTQDFELSFVTCTPPSPGADCAEPPGPPPASPCPELDAIYRERPGDPPIDEPDAGPAPAAPPPPPAEEAGGCEVTPLEPTSWRWLSLLGLPAAALARRRRRGSRGSTATAGGPFAPAR